MQTFQFLPMSNSAALHQDHLFHVEAVLLIRPVPWIDLQVATVIPVLSYSVSLPPFSPPSGDIPVHHFQIMITLSQTNKSTPEKIAHLASTLTDTTQLLLCIQALKSKNQALRNKEVSLSTRLASLRRENLKCIHQLNFSVEQSLSKTKQEVLDRHSRPDSQAMIKLSALFSDIQTASKIIARNSAAISSFLEELSIEQTNAALSLPENPFIKKLDQEYETLNSECALEALKEAKLKQERSRQKEAHGKIAESIEEGRVKYEKVEETIRESQRQLSHLTGYLRSRQLEDEEKHKELRDRSQLLEGELMRAQQILTFQQAKGEMLDIQRME